MEQWEEGMGGVDTSREGTGDLNGGEVDAVTIIKEEHSSYVKLCHRPVLRIAQ